MKIKKIIMYTLLLILLSLMAGFSVIGVMFVMNIMYGWSLGIGAAAGLSIELLLAVIIGYFYLSLNETKF